MPALVINKRPYRTFLSHAHVDKAIVDRMYHWLSRSAGLKVWYDSVELPPAHMVPSALGAAIADCQSAIIVLSESSLKSGWVQREWNICVGQQAEFSRFPDYSDPARR
jgi:hypothetical protein